MCRDSSGKKRLHGPVTQDVQLNVICGEVAYLVKHDYSS